MKKFKIIILLVLSAILITSLSTTATANTGDESVYVIPGGEPFGIKMFSEGLIVTNLEEFTVQNKKICPGKEAGLKENDIIYSADGKILYSNQELKTVIEKSQGKTIKLKIKRNNKFKDIYLIPKLNCENVYKAGIWVKDSAAGLGTITFYRSDAGTFCGLGHGICEKNTQTMIPLSYGELDKANVTSVTKSICGDVGTLNGYFTDEIIGKAACNHETGIYGYMTSNSLKKDKLEIADKKEVKKGKAYIYTTLNGEIPDKYEVEITKLNYNHNTMNMTVKITDKRLLNETGGIVQGMSGSPIIQNGKLVGAVTHVLVDKVNYGYGIFAQTMYEIMDEVC